ncbi:hypothetical protein OG389_05020 [Streptomyces sp. NBC_00435]|uniref:hypothetical protein n=1 Tax=unclassified Streptomyces TaxID=2593676 RepID=UPI002E211A87
MTDSIEPDVLYGQTPGSSHPLWVAVLKDLPHALAVLERHGFQPTMIGDLELFALPEETSTQLSAELHLASYTELANAGYTVMSTPAHPALPIELLGRIERRTVLGPTRPPSAGPEQGQGASPGSPRTAAPAAKPAVPDTFRRPPTRGGG